MNTKRGTSSGRIRVIGGSLRNSRLNVPEVPGLRPTPERVRETVFNWLAPIITGARCLDLCAGTGALGIEALSRGAASVQFVERDPRATQALRDNLTRFKTTAGEVALTDAQQFLENVPRPMDVVFLDPPFALDIWTTLAQQLERGGWLAAGAHIYVESPRSGMLALPPAWRLHREGAAGEVKFAIYVR